MVAQVLIVGGRRISGHQPDNEFKTSLGYVDPYSKNQRQDGACISASVVFAQSM